MHKKVAIAVSSYNEVFYKDGAKTGVFVVEALHPFEVFHENKFEIDFILETGSFGWDEHSLSADFLPENDKAVWKDKNSAFSKALAQIKTPQQVNALDYDIFFASAGHAPLFDYPKAKGLQKLAEDIYAQGGIVSAVCHGPAIFDGMKDPNTGKAFINGKAITGFTDLGEKLLGVESTMKEKGLLSVEDLAKRDNAIYLPPIGPWDDYSATDGRVVTGVNPASAASTAKRCIIALKHAHKKIPHQSVTDLKELAAESIH